MVDLWCTVRVWLVGAGRVLAIASAWSGTREKAQGRLTSLRGFVACRNSFSEFGKLFRLLDIFSDRSRRFPINRGRGGGRVRNFFSEFFFFASFGGGEGGGGERVTPKPEAQVARFLVGMFRNRFLEEVKRKKCHQKYRSIKRSMKKCHQIILF